ncbi:transglycosylase domain-containing protein, partial [Patescibacteria group bacterium]|nr:transglycosylase domain-containing protein [Patescibacteria group bacterium]
NFYTHGAIDLRGITRAAYSTIFHKELQGGSTLTQQLVKNTLLTQERTITRKVKEIILAFATELVYSKNQVLEMYLNQTPYGGTAWGVEAAAQTYFGKHAKELSLAESSLLAGLPEAPSAYSPFGSHPEYAKQRQKQVLDAMLEEGYISKDQRDKAFKEELKYKRFSNSIKAPHFVLYVKDLLTKRYGQRMVEEGGLRVTTSLDLGLQEYAQASVAAEVERLSGSHVTNGAAMITNPKTGEILAMVGSKDYFNKDIDGNVNLTTSLRQPGSSIKPINYATGLIKGYTAATPFIDEPICFPNQGGKSYCPVNYDGKFHGVVTMRTSLGNSFNIPAVKMLKANGIQAMIATASAMGISTFKNPDNYGLSLTLGGGEVTMVDMTQAFSVFATQGYKINLQPILKVTDRFGKVIEEYDPPKSPIFGKKVIPEGVAFIISDILADNNARLIEFGPNSELRIPGKTVSVKTGTTNDFRDNWTIGYTPSYVVSTWVGNNDNTPMGGVVSGITGAAPIWHDIMSYLLKNKPNEPFKKPGTVIQKPTCEFNAAPSKPEGAGKCFGRSEYFIKGMENYQFSLKTEKIWVDKNTQQPPPPGAPADNLELKEAQIIYDASGDKYCVNCPHPTSAPTPTP